MKSHTLKIGIASLAAIGTLGIGATALAANNTGTVENVAAATQVKGQKICSNLDQIHTKASTREQHIGDREARLKEHRATAFAAGHTAVVARIDARLAMLTKREQRVEKRITKVDKWAAKHCPVTPTPTPTPAAESPATSTPDVSTTAA
ncbi:MAG: hypothetical protein ABIQ39_07730 [Ilumatobacteraceae bacterium]